MVSNRNYFSIIIMMLVLLFLFQFTMVMKDNINRYDVNDNLMQPTQTTQKWELKEVSVTETAQEEDVFVLYVGREYSDAENVVRQWCAYTKRNLAECKKLEEYPQDAKNPEVVILESEKLSKEEIRRLYEMAQKGVHIVFENVDDVEEIRANQELRELLGISEIVTEETTVNGIKLFEGLLLGGEVIYQPESEEEKRERQDLELSMPWYIPGSGTKVYMVGLFGENDGIENEELPAIMWKHTVGNASVFAVNGDYLNSVTGLGFLSGFLADTKEYEIYPVMNAQNLSVVNFPGFADENSEVLSRIYSRNMSSLYRDIVWPGLVAIADQNQWKMTCFVTPQFDYMDENEPDGEELTFYLKQLKEVSAEAGFSLDYTSGVSLGDKINRDEKFFTAQNSKYLYGAVFVKPGKISSMLSMSESKLLQNVRSIVCEYTEQRPVFEYCNEDVLVQMITNDGAKHTYADDLRMRSLESALGYTNIMLDMRKVSWPEKEEDGWEIVYHDFSSHLNTYWQKYDYFAKTTLSESYKKAEAFFGMNYTQDREGDKISMQISGEGNTYWFILRTQGEEIEKVEGGTYQEIEKNTYLIGIQEKEAGIYLKQKGLYFYMTE